MTRRTTLARLERLEQAKSGEDVAMTIPCVYFDEHGRVVHEAPAVPIPDWDNPHRKVDYRAGIWECGA